MLHKLDRPTLQDWRKQQCLSFFYKVVEGLVPAMPVEQFLKTLPANKRQISPTKFHDFTAENIIDRRATLNSRPFFVPHSSTEQHKNSFFVRTTTDWNHISADQVKAPTLKDFKQRIITQSTIWFARAHSPKVRSSDVSHQDQDQDRFLFVLFFKCSLVLGQNNWVGMHATLCLPGLINLSVSESSFNINWRVMNRPQLQFFLFFSCYKMNSFPPWYWHHSVLTLWFTGLYISSNLTSLALSQARKFDFVLQETQVVACFVTSVWRWQNMLNKFDVLPACFVITWWQIVLKGSLAACFVIPLSSLL